MIDSKIKVNIHIIPTHSRYPKSKTATRPSSLVRSGYFRVCSVYMVTKNLACAIICQPTTTWRRTWKSVLTPLHIYFQNNAWNTYHTDTPYNSSRRCFAMPWWCLMMPCTPFHVFHIVENNDDEKPKMKAFSPSSTEIW